jgi:hypothetical protein
MRHFKNSNKEEYCNIKEEVIDFGCSCASKVASE